MDNQAVTQTGNQTDNQIFREKSLERISSPEQLQDYMKVTNPGIWTILIAVIVLLAGLFVCSVTGKLETTVKATAIVDKGVATIVVTGADAEKIKADMTLRVNNQEYRIRELDWNVDGSALILADVDLPDGKYDAVIVTETVSPIHFLLN